MICERLTAYYPKNNNKLPSHILFYRDGVSESQYGMVKDEELPQIRDGFLRAAEDLRIKENKLPQITLIVVGKRHHARFYVEPATIKPPSWSRR